MNKIENEIFSSIDKSFHETIWNDIPSDQILYHYTDCDSLISIIDNKEFWMSSVELMNDKEEVDYSLTLVKEVISELEIVDERKNELLENFVNFKKLSAINTYVLSFSTEPDALILWNNYGKNEGYNLGFRLATLHKDLNKKNAKLVSDIVCKLISGKVLYKKPLQKKMLSTLFQAYYNLYRFKHGAGIKKVEEDRAVIKIWTMIILYSSLLKSELHEMENEYRILLTTPDDSKAIKFRSRSGLVLPYVKMKFSNFSSLEEITIGPKIDDQITKETLSYFLEKKIEKDIITKPSALRLRF